LNGVFGLPAAVVFGVAGVIIGSTIGLEDMGAEIGAEAGMNLGAGVAGNVDKSGGGWEWVPGRIFVTLVRTEIAAEVAAERREPPR
jgi:hypothetical protein